MGLLGYNELSMDEIRRVKGYQEDWGSKIDMVGLFYTIASRLYVSHKSVMTRHHAKKGGVPEMSYLQRAFPILIQKPSFHSITE